jgi:hypothetical protein
MGQQELHGDDPNVSVSVACTHATRLLSVQCVGGKPVICAYCNVQVCHMAWTWLAATCQAPVTTSSWSSPHTSWQEASCASQGYSL